METNLNNESKLLDKDKLILVFYIGVKQLSHDRANIILAEISDKFKNEFDNSIIPLIIPNRDENNIRVEALNPVNLTQENWDVIEKLKDVVNKFYEEYSK